MSGKNLLSQNHLFTLKQLRELYFSTVVVHWCSASVLWYEVLFVFVSVLAPSESWKRLQTMYYVEADLYIIQGMR